MRHSELKNAQDLHFSRLKLFAGDISGVSPDFADQILASTSDNKIYRSTGTSEGQMVELSPQPLIPQPQIIFDDAFPFPTNYNQILVRLDQNRIYRPTGFLQDSWVEVSGGATGGATGGAVTVGSLPLAVPASGSLHYDDQQGMLYISASHGRWIGVTHNLNLQVTITENTSTGQLGNLGLSGVGEFSFIDYQPHLFSAGLSRYLLKGGVGNFYFFELSDEYKRYPVSCTKNFISGDPWAEDCISTSPNGLTLNYYPNRPITLGLNIVVNETDL